MSKPKGKKDDGVVDNAAKIQMLDFETKRWQMRIVEEQMRADRAKTAEMQLQQRMIELDKEFKVEKDKLYNISNDMNRQYRQMQDELQKDIDVFKKSVIQKDDTIKQKEQEINEYINDYEGKLRKKDQDITDYKRKIEDISQEFAAMLKDTLQKMQQRIELAQWDNDQDPQILKQFKDLPS